MAQQRWRVVVGAVGLACLLRWVCGNSAAVEPARGVPDVLGTLVVGEGSPGSDASATDWWSHADKLLSVAETSKRVAVPNLTLVAMDGSRLIVVGTVDARCHPQEREESMVSRPQEAAVGVLPHGSRVQDVGVWSGSSPDSATLAVPVLPEGFAIQDVVVLSNSVDVPAMTVLAMDGSRLVVVEMIDARGHPQGLEAQVGAVGAASDQEE
jgi:hypothetical protein